MCKSQFLAYKCLVLFVSFVFLFTNVPLASSQQFSFDKLSPFWATVDSALKEKLSLDWSYREMMYLIAEYYFSAKEKGTLEDFLREEVSKLSDSGKKERLKKIKINLKGVKFEKQAVFIPFVKDNKKYAAIVSKNKDKEDLKYRVEIKRDNVQIQDTGNNLKGKNAEDADNPINGFIKEGKVVEIYIDEKGELRANKVKWLEDYQPMLTSPKEYLGEEVDLSQFFVLTERENIKIWLNKNSIKFRSILGEAAIKWTADLDTSNISHAGPRDNVVYLGNLLLRALFGNTKNKVLENLLDNYELKKVRGQYNSWNDDDNKKRLLDVSSFINSLEHYKQIMLKRDVKGIYKFIEICLQGDSGDYSKSCLLFFLAVCNEICLIRPKTPVENRYPIKHAISLLSKEKQTGLVNLLISPQAVEYRNMILVDDILMMLDKTQRLKNWTEVYVPELNNCTLWMISPEIWHEAGGLARVMQYHSAGMHNLLKGSNARLKTLEFQYQYRIDVEGKAQTLDYTNDLTHSFKKLEWIDEFTITVGGKDVKAEVNYGKNDIGIEGYFLRDVQPDGNSYYCHSLYNYRDPWVAPNGLPTWEEFSVFASKASMEFLKRFSQREKELIEKKGEAWKAPFCHFNDSQFSLAVIYHRMELDKEREKKHNDSHYEIDPIISGMITGFSSHTYGNRKDYPLRDGQGDRVMNFMEVPYQYRGIFKHIKDHLGEVYDMASGGLRLSDWQGMVSEAQLKDLSLWDEWINVSSNPAAKTMKKDLKDPLLEMDIIAVSNGDNREATAEAFRRIIKETNPEADVENLTVDQLKKTRVEVKKQIQPDKDRVYYTTKQDNRFLNPNQLVMSYSGRLVGVKVDIENAFTYHNVEELVRKGVQVVIYGNSQTNNPESGRLVGYFINLVNYLRPKNYPGRLIFVPRFSLKEERELKAASDIGIHSSRAKTEAAGQTETNDTACYGLVIAPPRVGEGYNGGIGEGLFQRQGMTLNPEVSGEGNTIVPKSLSPEAYLEAFEILINLWEQNKIEPYQITSNSLGRVLDADSTSAEYLRQFSSAIKRKREKDNMLTILEQEEQKAMESRSLIYQLFVPKQEEKPKEYAVYKIAELVTKGRIDEARLLFFTSKEFQGLKKNLDVPAGVLNRLLDAYIEKDNDNKESIKNFVNALKDDIIEFTGNSEEAVEVAHAVQIMAAQALNIISWIDRSEKDQELCYLRDLRLTIDEWCMIQNDKHGKSFLDAGTLPRGTVEVKKEREYGFFNRGFEGIKKLGKNIFKGLIYDETRFKNAEKKFIQYIMVHFPLPLDPNADSFMKEAALQDKISPMHETFFLHSVLRGARQALSTGAGHLQVQKLDTSLVGVLDVKHVTEGNGYQVNVKYNINGERVTTKIRKIKQGDICVSLPGWVDYMIGDKLRFNDFSVPLPNNELAKKFDIYYDKEKLEGIEKALREQDNYAPYIGMKAHAGIVLIKNPAGDKKSAGYTVWEKFVEEDILRKKSLISMYNKFESMDEVYGFIARLAKSIEIDHLQDQAPMMDYEGMMGYSSDTRGVSEPSTLGKVNGINAYINDDETFLSKILSENADTKKLIRIPVELLRNVDAENAAKILSTMQSEKSSVHIELFSMEDSVRVITAIEYRNYGITKKDLPRSLYKENRNRANTITLFSVEKGEKLPASENNRRWIDRLGGQPLDKTVISPIGIDFDPAGLVRGVFLGLALSEIAANTAYGAESNFVSYTLAQYLRLCIALGQEPCDLKILQAQDLVNIARGDINVLVESLNKLIKCLPIMPLNIEEKRVIYERAREVWLRA